jgi:hypothetical protein
MPHQSHSPWFDDCNNVLWSVQVTKLWNRSMKWHPVLGRWRDQLSTHVQGPLPQWDRLDVICPLEFVNTPEYGISDKQWPNFL